MTIYLDDVRIAPDGWVQTRWPSDTIEYLKTGQVRYLSLDHDLGDDNIGTGYDVLLWIEKEVYLNDFRPPIMSVHSANVSARKKMEQAIVQIHKLIYI